MGMFRETDDQQFDVIKEMAEGLGSQGLRLDDLLEKAESARVVAMGLIASYGDSGLNGERPDISEVNDSIRHFNSLVDKAEDALRWLLIQREACGFRTHKNVDRFYPIPEKIRPIKS